MIAPTSTNACKSRSAVLAETPARFWYEIHYGIPTGFDPDRFLTSGPDESGNGGGDGKDNGYKNSRRKRGKPKKRDNCEDISTQKFFGEKHGEGSMLSHLHKEVYKESWSPIFLCKGLVIEPRLS